MTTALTSKDLIKLRKDRARVPGDYFLMIHATYCGFCKSAMPEFLKASKKSIAVDFATIDETQFPLFQDVYPDVFPIEGYPTFYYVSSQVAKPIKYEGERTEAAMLAFIRQME